MKSESLLARRRILLVDDDSALLGLIASLLEEGGSQVDRIAGVEGFTPELMALGRPSLVLLNPIMKGIAPALMRSVIDNFKATARKPIILVADVPADALAALALELGADGYIPLRDLLEDPLSHVLSHAPSTQPAQSESDAGRPLEILAPEDILDLELNPLNTPPLPPAVTPPPERPFASGIGQTPAGELILSSIAEELSKFEEVSGGAEEFKISLDVFGEHNLYVDGKAALVGVFIASSMMMPAVGSAVRVCLRFPWRSQITCECTVDWTRDSSWMNRRNRSGFGARFPELASSDRQHLDRFLGQRAAMKIAPPVIAGARR